MRDSPPPREELTKEYGPVPLIEACGGCDCHDGHVCSTECRCGCCCSVVAVAEYSGPIRVLFTPHGRPY